MKFSLIIPVAPSRNAPILKDIDKLDYLKKDFEVIVEEGLNTSENRNKGWKKAKGDFVVFLDDDAFMKKDYLKKLEVFLERYSEVDIVGGPQLNPENESFFAKMSGIALTSSFGAFKVNKRYSKKEPSFNVDESALTSCNLCFKKNVLKKIGGFDLGLFPGEDPEIIQRSKKNNLKIAYNPEMQLFHKRRPTFSLFSKQFFKYGFMRPKVNKILKQFKLMFAIPMLFAIYMLFIFTLSYIHIIFIYPFLLYIVLTVLFSIVDSARNRSFVGLFLLPFMYFTIHVSYGLGMVVGYLNLGMKNEKS